MIRFRHRKIDNHDYKIYMVKIEDSLNQKYINIIPIPGPCFCYTKSKEVTRKVCQLLESVTKRQNIQNWNRQTLKQVQQIVRIINRIYFHGHTYPIPFEKLEKILGKNLANWAASESYKRRMATYKLEFNELKFKKIGHYEHENGEMKWISAKPFIKKGLVEDLIDDFREPTGYIYNEEKGEYLKNT